jgi:hypothetical protein
MRVAVNRLLALIFFSRSRHAIPPKTAVPEIVDATFAPALNVDISTMTKTASGLYYRDSIVGTGTTASSPRFCSRQLHRVAHVGRAVRQQLFAGEPDRLQPWPGVCDCRLGRGNREHARRRLAQTGHPPQLGYGDQGVGTIPPNSILVFNVQLVSVIK